MAKSKVQFGEQIPWTRVIVDKTGEKERYIYAKFNATMQPGPQITLVKFDPHARMGRHSHGANHVLYVLSGELEVEGVVLKEGDCVELPEGHVYGEEKAGAQGCVCILSFASYAEMAFENPDAGCYAAPELNAWLEGHQGEPRS